MLYIMRHSKTDWNNEHRLQGRTDTELNEEGRALAREAAETYKDIHIDVCFCSPMKRAVETADIVLSGRDIPVLYDDRLTEMSFGVCEGTVNLFSDANGPMKEFFFNPKAYKAVEGGESIDEVMVRTKDFLDDKIYPLLEEDKDVLIVGHGAINSAITCRILYDCDLDHFWDKGAKNCHMMKLIDNQVVHEIME